MHGWLVLDCISAYPTALIDLFTDSDDAKDDAGSQADEQREGQPGSDGSFKLVRILKLTGLFSRKVRVSRPVHVSRAIVLEEDNLGLQLRLHLDVGGEPPEARNHRAQDSGGQLLEQDCAPVRFGEHTLAKLELLHCLIPLVQVADHRCEAALLGQVVNRAVESVPLSLGPRLQGHNDPPPSLQAVQAGNLQELLGLGSSGKCKVQLEYVLALPLLLARAMRVDLCTYGFKTIAPRG